MNEIAAAQAASMVAKPLILVYIFSHVLEDFVPVYYCHSTDEAQAQAAKLNAAGVKSWAIQQSREEFLRTIKDLPAQAEKKFA